MGEKLESVTLTPAQANKVRELDAAMLHFIRYLQMEHGVSPETGWRLDIANGRYVRAVNSEDTADG